MSARTAKTAPTVRSGLQNDWQLTTADHFVAAADVQLHPNRVRDNVATGFKVDGAVLVPRGAAQGNTRGGTYATRD